MAVGGERFVRFEWQEGMGGWGVKKEQIKGLSMRRINVTLAKYFIDWVYFNLSESGTIIHFIQLVTFFNIC